MKKCPYCAEEIQDEAIFCRYCRRELDNALTHNEELAKKREIILNQAIARYQAEGWILISNSDGVARLRKSITLTTDDHANLVVNENVSIPIVGRPLIPEEPTSGNYTPKPLTPKELARQKKERKPMYKPCPSCGKPILQNSSTCEYCDIPLPDGFWDYGGVT